MAIFHDSKVSFGGGEVSPLLHKRVDMQKYSVWLKKARNIMFDVCGAFFNRPGFIFNGLSKFEDKVVKLLPFEFNKSQAYCLEFGDGYVRIRDNEKLLLNEDGSPVEAISKFQAEGLSTLNGAQSADVLFLTNGKQIPQMLKRYALTDWRMEEYKAKNGPFMAYNTDENSTIALTVNNENQSSIATLPMGALVFYKAISSHVKIDDEIIFTGLESTGIEEFVANFNAQNNKNITAEAEAVDGGYVKFTTPASEGEAFNNKILTFTFIYKMIFNQERTWSTFGSFAGGVGNNNNTGVALTASKDIFKPGHVGALFKLEKYIAEQNIDMGITQPMLSATLKSNGQWRLITSGGWAGKLVIEISFDLGKTWKEYRTTKSNNPDAPFNENVYNTIDTDDIVYMRLNAKEIRGSLTVFFACEAFKQNCICRVVEYIDEKNARAIIERGNVGDIEATHEWAEGSFSNVRGWPKIVFLHQGRLGFASTDSEPDTFWLTKTNDFWDFGSARKIQDDDAISARILSYKLNAITGVAPQKDLLVFTSGAEFGVTAGGGPLTQTNKEAKQYTNFGSEDIAPLTIGNKVIFVQKQGTVVRQFNYDYTADGFNGVALSTTFRHQLENRKITQTAYAQDPHNIIYMLRDDGALICMTYLPEEEYYAWAIIERQGVIENICVIPAKGYDQLFVSVLFNEKRWIEKMAPRFKSKDPKEQIFLDACITYSGEEKQEIDGLEHLEGYRVNALANGCVEKNLLVTNGKVRLQSPTSIAHIGLGYTAKAVLLPSEIQSDKGMTLATPRRIVKADIFLQDSVGVHIGVEGQPADEVVFRTTENFNEPIKLKSGMYSQSLTSSHDVSACLSIEQPDPLPLCVTAIVPTVDFGGNK